MESMKSKPVLIDTDTGVDDAMALFVALNSPELSVKAITTVAGNIDVSKCTRNVERILKLLNVQDRPIVAEGAARPLKLPLVKASEVHGKDGLGDVPKYVPRVRSSRHPDAIETLLRCCEQYGPRLTIIAIGPLTNLAIALKKNPRVMRKVGRIVTMGGAIRVAGNTGPVAEFNYFVDPDAAHIVLNSGIPVTVIPLDVTHQVVVMRKEMEYRAKRRASRAALALLKFTESYMKYHLATQGFNGGYLHDPMAVGVAIDPSLVKTRRIHVDVESRGAYTRGMTVTDLKEHGSRSVPTVDVALAIDRERFLKLFHDRLWK
jgi:inosine-uridine nucleoside N-ribohydrolase